MSDPDRGIQPQRLRQLLHRLVDIYSPSGKEEEILEFLHGYCRRQGLAPLRQPVDENRHNLIVAPASDEIQLALIGHVDTVAAFDLDHYGYEEHDDQILGLGTADMKAGCAAMIEAYLALRQLRGPAVPVALALVVGEEEEGDGARRLVKDFRFPWAVIGEPTDLKPCLGHYGYLEIQISTRGKRMHASLANQGHNAVEAMLRLLLKLSRYLEEHRPELVYNVRDLFSSRAGFVVPDRCEAWLDVHLPPAAPIGSITLELEALLAEERNANPALDAALRFAMIHAGYEIPERGPMLEALKGIYGRRGLPMEELQAFRSHSDANELWAAGVKPLLLGPGQLEKAHAPDESVSFQQVCLAAELYLELLASLYP
ncbi:MAG: M20/M25/M40 family metallo-hydrolase [bacterium]